MIDGVLIVDKDRGWTSHDVVSRVRKVLGQRKVGHTGTLDPMATGVLVVCLGRATRIVRFLDDGEKAYTAEIRLGVSTDTFDAEGAVTQIKAVPDFTMEEIETVCGAFRGRIRQVPPMFSAVKVSGRKLYELAREGREIPRAPREVIVSELDILSYRTPILRIKVVCSKGTYVRALAHDIGKHLGPGGHLAALRRTRCGRFTEAQSLPMAQVASEAEEGTIRQHILSMEEALGSLLRVRVSGSAEERFRHGAWVRRWDIANKDVREADVNVRELEHKGGEDIAADRMSVVLGAHGDLLGIGRWSRDSMSGEVLRPVCVFG